jgi:MFS family permease
VSRPPSDDGPDARGATGPHTPDHADGETDGLAGAGRLADLSRYDALVAVALLWLLAKLLRYALPPLFGHLQGSYGVSTTVLGTAYTGLMAAYAAMQFPSGALADRFGPVPIVVAGGAVAAVGAAVIGVTATLPALVAGMVVFGLGSGAHKTVAVGLISRAYPRRPGRALGVMDTLGATGGLVGPAIAVALLPDWRGLYLGGAVAAVVLAVGVGRLAPPRLRPETAVDQPDATSGRPSPGGSPQATGPASRPEADVGPGPDPRSARSGRATAPDGTDGPSGASDRRGAWTALASYLTPFRDWRFAAFALSTIPFTFASGGALAFLPLYFERVGGVSTATAGTLYAAVFVGAFAQLASGELGDRVGHLPVAVGSILLATVGLAVVATAPPLAGLAVAAVAVGAGFHGILPVRGAYMMRVLPDATAAGSLGIVRTGFMGASAAAPAVVGYLADTAGLPTAMWVLVGVAAVAVVPAASLFVGR